MKKIATFFLASVLGVTIFSFTSKNEVSETLAVDYYAEVTSSMKGDTLKNKLRDIIKKNHVKYDYDNLEIAMRTADRNWELSPDPNDENPYMVLLYADYNESNPARWNTSQGSYGVSSGYIWNKEHIWAKSNGFNTKSLAAYSDLHHLRASDHKLNNTRSNNPFGNVSSNAYATDAHGNKSTCKYASGVFEPSDQYKGDVARALFYMATRYAVAGDGTSSALSLTTGTDSSGGKWGYLDTLLEWHEQDQPDEFEIHRNDLVQGLQGNRNPYIDHPEYARAVFKNEPIVESKKLTSLEKSGTPNKTIYKEGERFVSTGLTITAKYDDGSSDNVTSSVSWEPSTLTKGTTKVVGTYKGFTLTVEGLTVNGLDELILSGSLLKTEYTAGEEFDPKGLVVKAKYGSEEIDVTSEVTWNPKYLSKGTTSVTGTYGSKFVTVNGISVTGEDVSDTSIEFKKSSDGSTVLSNTAFFDNVTAGKEYIDSIEITKVYAGANGLKFSSSKENGSLTLNLKSDLIGEITGIKVTTAAYSTDNATFKVKTNFDTTGKSITIGEENELLEFKGNLSSLTFEATKRCYLSSIILITNNIEVKVSLKTIEVKNQTLEYFVDDEFTFDGELIAHYTDNTSEYVTPTSISSPDMTTSGIKKVYVTYTEEGVTAKTSFNITVKEKQGGNGEEETISVTSILLNFTSYTCNVGDVFTLEATINPNDATNKGIIWSSSNEEIATVNNGEVTTKKSGTVIITITSIDGGFTASCNVKVIGAAPITTSTQGCGGNIITTSVLLFTISGALLLTIFIRRKKLY